jgi:hypothetical protein
MHPSQLYHLATAEVTPIRYPSTTGLLHMKLGFGYLEFSDDPSRSSFVVCVWASWRAHTHKINPRTTDDGSNYDARNKRRTHTTTNHVSDVHA